MNERPIPEAALRDENSVEMLRVWIAEEKLHCSLKIGMYRDTMDIAEEKAWGTILADVARHVANALKAGYSSDVRESIEKLKETFIEELESPTSETAGNFVHRH